MIKFRSNIFVSVWFVFILLIISYSLYILLKSPDLELHLKPHTNQIVSYTSFRIILGIFFFISILGIKNICGRVLWLVVIILTGFLSRIILIPSVPVLEDDYNRYLWDGAVTAHFYNPYEYSPLDVVTNEKGIPQELHDLSYQSGKIVNHINHPHIRTIYPIISQFTFAAAYIISPWNIWSWKLLLLIFDLILLLVLLKITKMLNLPAVLISIYWLNPVVIHEFFNAGHMDLLALVFVVISIYLMLKNRLIISIIFLALAVGIKLWPLILLPLILQKAWSDKKVFANLMVIFGVIVFVLFLPVLTTNIDKELGFVIYAGKWVNNSALYEIFRWVVRQVVHLLPIQIDCLSCINRVGITLIFIVTAIFVYKKTITDNIQLFNKALLIIALLYLISPTQFPWYYTWFIPFLVIRPKVSLLLYAILLPLYQLNYLSDYILYIQHIPILILFVLEVSGIIWKDYWSFLGIRSIFTENHTGFVSRV